MNVAPWTVPGSPFASASQSLGIGGDQQEVEVGRFFAGRFHGRIDRLKVNGMDLHQKVGELYSNKIPRGEARKAANSSSKLEVKAPVPSVD